LLLFLFPKKKQLEHAPTATPPRERSTKEVVTVLRILSTIPARLCNRPSASFGGTPFYRKIILGFCSPLSRLLMSTAPQLWLSITLKHEISCVKRKSFSFYPLTHAVTFFDR